MTAPLILGGPLAIGCTFCSAPKGETCASTDRGGVNVFLTRKPHAARVKAAPPTVEAHVGDLVIVRHRGEHVVQLVEIGTVLSVRFWRPSAQVFASPRLLEREAVIGLAPDDARTAMAREELRLQADCVRLPDDIVPALAPDIAEGRGPFDPGQTMSDPSPTTPDAPPDPCFTSDSAETTARKDW